MTRINPLSNVSYTDQGNKYRKTSLFTNAAIIAVGANVVLDGVAVAYRAAKNTKLESFKPANILANAKNQLVSFFIGLEKFAVKAQIKLLKPAAEKAAETAAKPSIFKRTFEGLKNLGGKIVETIKNPKMPEILKNPKVVKAAGALGVAAGILALGIAVDYTINNIRAKNADKEVMIK